MQCWIFKPNVPPLPASTRKDTRAESRETDPSDHHRRKDSVAPDSGDGHPGIADETFFPFASVAAEAAAGSQVSTGCTFQETASALLHLRRDAIAFACDASTSLAWSGCWVCGVVLQCLIFYFGVALIIGISALGTGAKMLRFYILEIPGLP